MNKAIQFALCFAASVAVTAPASAATTIFTGDTTGGPTFNRPIDDGNNAPNTLSGVGTAVRYVVTPFTVSVSGGYNFTNATNYDSYLGIHANSFSPSNPLINAIAYSDDFNGTLDGGFNALSLLAGTSYFAVSSGFDNTDFGAFQLTISGPGTITGGAVSAAPEPAAWVMMIAGFGIVGGALRRRRQRVTVAYA